MATIVSLLFFLPDTAGFLCTMCMALKDYTEFLIHRKTINCGDFDWDRDLIPSWSAQEYSLLCPFSHVKLCPAVTAAVKDLPVFFLWTLFNWVATYLWVSLQVEIWPVNCNFGKSIFLIIKLLKCFQIHWKQDTGCSNASSPCCCCLCTG